MNGVRTKKRQIKTMRTENKVKSRSVDKKPRSNLTMCKQIVGYIRVITNELQ